MVHCGMASYDRADQNTLAACQNNAWGQSASATGCASGGERASRLNQAFPGLSRAPVKTVIMLCRLGLIREGSRCSEPGGCKPARTLRGTGPGAAAEKP